MLNLSKGSKLYIYSSEEAVFTIISDSGKVLFEYPVRANTTRLVYESAIATKISIIYVLAQISNTLIKVYVNGADMAHQVYQKIVPENNTLLLDSKGWVGNTFVPIPDDSSGDVENDFVALAVVL